MCAMPSAATPTWRIHESERGSMALRHEESEARSIMPEKMPETAETKQLAVAVIGVRAMGRRHAQALASWEPFAGARLAAAVRPQRGGPGSAYGSSSLPLRREELFDANLASGVVIAALTPSTRRSASRRSTAGSTCSWSRPSSNCAEGRTGLARYAELGVAAPAVRGGAHLEGRSPLRPDSRARSRRDGSARCITSPGRSPTAFAPRVTTGKAPEAAAFEGRAADCS